MGMQGAMMNTAMMLGDMMMHPSMMQQHQHHQQHQQPAMYPGAAPGTPL
jgi:hypothetical protein